MPSFIPFQSIKSFARVIWKKGETMKSVLIAAAALFSLNSNADVIVVQEQKLSEESMLSCEDAKNKLLQKIGSYEGVSKVRLQTCREIPLHNNVRYSLSLTLERELGLLGD